MHNVRRLSVDKRTSRRKENLERAAAYRKRSEICFERRANKQHDQETLDAIAQVVSENTDFATLWNFRREVLQAMHPDAAVAGAASNGDAIGLARKAACAAEFQLTQECLAANPKSYPVWYHRQWVLTWGRCAWQWPVELKLTSKLLALDDRNFHCWTYRRFVVQTAGITADAELGFSTSKIEANFSNYSAWHHRSKLLPQIHETGGTDAATLRGVLKEELQLVRNAFFTAPEDSSAWFYHRWLLAQLRPTGPAQVAPEEYEGLVREELSMSEELLELEPECKWVLAATAYLHNRLGEHLAVRGEAGVNVERSAYAEKLRELNRVDVMRANYYADMGAAVPT